METCHWNFECNLRFFLAWEIVKRKTSVPIDHPVDIVIRKLNITIVSGPENLAYMANTG